MFNDVLTAYLIDKTGKTIPITNITSYALERDFFIAADEFNLEISDDRASKLYSVLQAGCEIYFDINGRPQLHGYVDRFGITYSRNAGRTLTIKGRDKLGQMSDAICPPNMIPPGQQGFTPLQFKSTTTLRQALETIFGCFGINDVLIDDSGDLTIGSGGRIGTAAKGKKAKSLVKSLSKNIVKNCRPEQHEGYLQYAMRLCKRNGLNIKLNLDNQGNPSVLVNPPTYDRTTPPVYSLFNLQDMNDARTNILSGNLGVDYQHQITCLIVEATYNGGIYHRDAKKVIAVNELTGYKLDSNGRITENLLDSVKTFIEGTTGKNGYILLPTNSDLIDAIPLSVMGITNGAVRPQFRKDDYAHSIDQLQFFAAAKLAELQRHFLTIEYEVAGHSNNNAVWQVNNLCSVLDETLDPSNPFSGNFWIQRRTFTRSRSGGTRTKLLLTLPNIYTFDVEE